METLTTAAIAAALAGLPGWALTDADGATAIQKQYQFKDFVAAMAFVNAVAGRAEEVGHHPDILIRYNRVTLTLSTHDAGGVTTRDIELAQRVQ